MIAKATSPGNPSRHTERVMARERKGELALALSIWSSWTDLNRRPHPYQGCALPLSYMSLTFSILTMLERAAGIEPASSAWKAEVLPLNYARLPTLSAAMKTHHCNPNLVEGEGFEPSKLSRQIYSLLPLATREPLQMAAHLITAAPIVKPLFYQCLSSAGDAIAPSPFASERGALCQSCMENASPARIFSRATGTGTRGAPAIRPARSAAVSGKHASRPP